MKHQNCVVKLDVTMKNLLWDFFSISILGLGFACWSKEKPGNGIETPPPPFRTLYNVS